MPKIQTNKEQLLMDSNWAQVFADENWGNVSKQVEIVPPGVLVSTAEFSRADVKKVIASVDGERDGESWLGLFQLKDGRYVVAEGSCDYTGWDCQAGNNLWVSDTLANILEFGLSEVERERLGLERMYKKHCIKKD